MASITIGRDAGYADRLRAYTILLDGEPLGELGEAETRTFAIVPGSHRLEARVDWCGAKPVAFTASEHEDLKFFVRSNLRGIKAPLLFWYTTAARQSYLHLRQVADLGGLVPSPKPLVLNQTAFVLKYGVFGFRLISGLLFLLANYLLGIPLTPFMSVFALIVWLASGVRWGKKMWRFTNERFGTEIAARNARIAARSTEA